jgi:hypothetical protein
LALETNAAATPTAAAANISTAIAATATSPARAYHRTIAQFVGPRKGLATARFVALPTLEKQAPLVGPFFAHSQLNHRDAVFFAHRYATQGTTTHSTTNSTAANTASATTASSSTSARTAPVTFASAANGVFNVHAHGSCGHPRHGPLLLLLL